MLLWTALLCLFSANLVASQFFLPEIFADYNPRTILKPYKNGLKSGSSSDNVRVIRALLAVRQTECPIGTTECSGFPGSCCPIGGTCCQPGACCEEGYYCYGTGCCENSFTGCGGNSCCSPTESCCEGGGCCEEGYYCAVVEGVSGCCVEGETCTPNTAPPECTNPGYVLCPEESFCCPGGYQCTRDTLNNPTCTSPIDTVSPEILPTPSFNTSSLSIPSTISLTTTTTTRSSTTTRPPSITPTSTRTSTTSTTTSTTTPGLSSNGTGAVSSALSVAVDTLLTLFAGVGVFAFLF